MKMPSLLPARHGPFDQSAFGSAQATLTGGRLAPASDASCHAACAAALALARTGCAALGPFAPPCLAAAEAAFLYCNTRC
jgi:hypothetical protein